MSDKYIRQINEDYKKVLEIINNTFNLKGEYNFHPFYSFNRDVISTKELEEFVK